MGRPPHSPTDMLRRQVEAMAAYGVPEADIGRVIGIDPKTLRKHYRSELDTGAVKANTRIAESLYRKALGDGPQSVTAAIFWLKTRARWKEATVHEVSGPEGNPITVIRRIIVSPGGRSEVPAPAMDAASTQWNEPRLRLLPSLVTG